MRKIKIENFRSLKMTEAIEIKPITLLFGKNGSGKSSFISAIQFLGLNLFPVKRDTTFLLDLDSNLMNFTETVFQKDSNNDINFYYEDSNTNLSFNITVAFSRDKNGKNLNRIEIEHIDNGITLSLYPNKKNNISLKKEIKEIWDSMEKISPSDIFERLNNPNIKKELFYQRNSPNKNISIDRNWIFTEKSFNDSKIKKFFSYLDILPFFTTNDTSTYKDNLFNYLEIDGEIRKKIEEILQVFIHFIPSTARRLLLGWHIPAIREKVRGSYPLIGGRFNQGDYYGCLSILDSEVESENIYDEGKFIPNLYEHINDALQKLTLAKKIYLKKKNGYGSLFIQDMNDVEHNLSNTSSGLIHILPIIIYSYYSQYYYEQQFGLDHSLGKYMISESPVIDTLIIEQPELHLHPSLQTKLAEFISEGKGTYIIETHSEHIVRKLQVLIAKGKLKKEEVAVYYFDKDDKTGITSIREMKLDERGRFLDDWPPGFFDTDTELALEFFREISKN
jgi:AAA15 family ATPase/GTPase